jgi:intracellular sulfur oxidation DsrE/DsrF family protein
MQENQHPRRREFIGQLGAIAMAATLPPAVGQIESARRHPSAPAWDMSWVDKVSAATYKVVVDTAKIEGDGLYTALDILDTFHEVYGGGSEQTRVVVVLRHFAAAMAQSDAMWEKYGIGEERSVTDPDTKAPAKRNPFLRAGPNAKESWEQNSKIEPLVARGVIFLACNRATLGLASSLAKRVNKPLDDVKEDLRTNVVPGATLMPNGIFALVRAQNAGCAFFRQ